MSVQPPILPPGPSPSLLLPGYRLTYPAWHNGPLQQAVVVTVPDGPAPGQEQPPG